VTTLFPVSHGEQACWQRRAAAQLVAILEDNRDLPLLAWTVGPAGACLAGRVDPVGPEERVRAAFEVWCQALAAGERGEASGPGGGCRLWATARTGRVRVALSASVLPDDGEG
jgi:hypothetical protein